MIAQEGCPTLTGWSGTLDHVFGDSRFGHLDTELEQLAMDPRRTPQPVGPAHLPDQLADLPGDRRAATRGARLPAPKRLESPPMPADQRLGSDDRDGIYYGRAEAVEPDQGQPICVG